jgi:DNA-directed RNA polymerase specialized sigma24 family protein
MAGPKAEAGDAVQESWLRLSRAGTSGAHNLRGWLTTVVAQQCFWTCFAPAPLRC